MQPTSSTLHHDASRGARGPGRRSSALASGGLAHAWALPRPRGAWVAALGLAAVALGALQQGRPASDADFARAVSRTYRDVTATVAPGVVRIATFRTRGGLPIALNQGSGVVMGADGVIVTNAHVVANADLLRVSFFDGQTVEARLVGADEDSDLAVLRVDRQDLTPLTLRVDPPPRVGEAVLAVGNPLGLGHTVTAGIVSGLGRAVGVATYEDFLQTDAAIHPGNSGGPLVDVDGRVIGLSTAVAAGSRGGQGIGFAIPARMIRDVGAELSEHGSVIRGYLGVQLEMSDASGRVARVGPGEFVGVQSVYEGSPAELGGLRAGDVILAFQGVAIESVSQMLATVARVRPGVEVTVLARRRGEELSVPIVLGTRPPAGGR